MDRTGALQTLHGRGAHLIAFHVERDGQDPRRKAYRLPKAWQERRSALDEVLAARHVGLIAGSLGLSCVDIDVKDGQDAPSRQRLGIERHAQVTRTLGETPAVERTPTGGLHCYYRWPRPHGKVHLDIEGRRIEVFGSTGFIELFDPVRLLEHLDALPTMRDGPVAATPRETWVGGRGRIEGDRHNGVFARARMAAKHDPDPVPAIASAIADGIAAGYSPWDATKTALDAARYGTHDRVPDPVPELEPEALPSNTPQKAPESVLKAWRAQESPQAMPEVFVPETVSQTPLARYEQPVDAWELAHHWAGEMEGRWRCVSEGDKVSWLVFEDGAGWRAVPKVFTLNAIRLHGRMHFWTATKDGKTRNPHAGSTNIVKTVEETARALDTVALAPDAMDADPWLTGLPGGRVIDARAGSVVKMEMRHLVRMRMAAAPDLGPGLLERVVAFHLPDPLEQAFFWCYLGRAFIGGHHREALLVPGDAFTAKSTVLEALAHAFHDYAKVTDAATLLGTGGSVHTQEATRAQMAGKRLVVLSEAGGETLSTKAFKQLVSDESIVGRLMGGGNPVEVKPTWSFVYGFNWEDAPVLDPSDDAAWSRIVVLPFLHPVPERERRPGLVRELCTPAESARTVGMLLRCGLEWAQRGMPPQSPRMAAARERMRRLAMPPVARFVSERMVHDPDGRLWLSEVREGFERWRRSQGEPGVSAKAMAKELRGLPGVDVGEMKARRLAVLGLAWRVSP